MTENEKNGLPVSGEKLREEVEGYFDRCGREGIPPTPSGLALQLGVRTSALSDDRLSEEQRKVIDQAMQRIEAGTLELMLTRGGVRGIESLLERVEERDGESRRRREIRGLSDEEIRTRLRRMMPGIRAAVEEKKG